MRKIVQQATLYGYPKIAEKTKSSIPVNARTMITIHGKTTCCEFSGGVILLYYFKIFTCWK